MRNGLAACPAHDVAFDLGYLTVNGGYRIHLAEILQAGVMTNEATRSFFGEATLGSALLLPPGAKKPDDSYLAYHREKIYRGS